MRENEAERIIDIQQFSLSFMIRLGIIVSLRLSVGILQSAFPVLRK